MENKNKERPNFFERLKFGLAKTRNSITSRVDELVKYYREIDEEFFEELEETLILADVGIETTEDIVNYIKKRVKEEKIGDVTKIKDLLKEKITSILAEDSSNPESKDRPTVILVVGVNGVGKTTTIGKLANRYRKTGKSVLVAAADTFGLPQENNWKFGVKAEVPLVVQEDKSDPAAVVFDAIQSAKSRKVDVLICDTAGRLHNKKNLMNELEKINRIINREYPAANKEVLLVVDATTGQNAIAQASIFKESVDITGIVLTKLDGTAKGGVVIAVKSQLGIPIYYLGVGEDMDDLQPFDPKAFVEALLN